MEIRCCRLLHKSAIFGTVVFVKWCLSPCKPKGLFYIVLPHMFQSKLSNLSFNRKGQSLLDQSCLLFDFPKSHLYIFKTPVLLKYKFNTFTSMWLCSNLSRPYWVRCFLSSRGLTSEDGIHILMCPIWGLLSALPSPLASTEGFITPFISPTEENSHHMEEVTVSAES